MPFFSFLRLRKKILNNFATQTLMSNLNTSNPVEVIGVMDNMSRVHLVWIENGSQPRLQYALIQTNYGPLGVDTVLISNTLIGYNNSTLGISPHIAVPILPTISTDFLAVLFKHLRVGIK